MPAKPCIWIWLIAGPFVGPKAQNLVPNPGFEVFTHCPSQFGLFKQGEIPNWTAIPSDCTPDYFHTCAKGDFGLPHSLGGTVPPYEGKACAGLIAGVGESKFEFRHRHYFTDLYYREFLQCRLSEPLEANRFYRVAMQVALAPRSNYTGAQIGLLLTDFPIVILENEAFVPKIKLDSTLSSPGQWVELSGNYQARGGEQYLTIGNFIPTREAPLVLLWKDRLRQTDFCYGRAYYFVDAVEVRLLESAPPSLDLPPPGTIASDFGPLTPGQPIILDDIQFAFDRDSLLPSSLPQLQSLWKLLHQYPQAEILVLGHTDSIGTEEKNLDLSQRRANRVRDWLIQRQIAPERVKARGLGESRPIDDNGTASGRQRNRRVEFIIRKTGRLPQSAP
ncbi:MAG: hypothetical protein OHK0053_30150 [Microscillaceae bacterium]